ncbi:hypothetical protein ACF0H5_021622 [Mactra antiquata]
MDFVLYDKNGVVIPTLAMMKNMSMHMGEYFFFSKDVKNFIFEDLNLKGTGGVIGACLICFAFTLLLEATKSLLYYLSLRINQNPLTYGRTDTSINHDRSTLFSALMIPTSMSQIRRQRLKFHISGYFLHTVDVIIGYLLMLSVMSYDAYIFISVIIGSGVGYFIFGAVNTRNRAKFLALKLHVYDRYDSQAGLTVSGSISNSEITVPSSR